MDEEDRFIMGLCPKCFLPSCTGKCEPLPAAVEKAECFPVLPSQLSWRPPCKETREILDCVDRDAIAILEPHELRKLVAHIRGGPDRIMRLRKSIRVRIRTAKVY